MLLEARQRCWFEGRRECRKCRLVLAVSENPAWFPSILPHAGPCLSLPRCVVFFQGFGLTLPFKSIVFALIPSPLPVPHLFLPRFFSFFLSLTRLLFFSLSHLMSNPVCIILPLSPIVPVSPVHNSLFFLCFFSASSFVLDYFSFFSTILLSMLTSSLT